MRRLLKSEDMQRRISQTHQRIELNAAMARTKLLMRWNDINDWALQIAADHQHKDRARMVIYLHEKLWPTKHVTESTHTHRIADETMAEASRTIDRVWRERGERERPARALLEGDGAVTRPEGRPEGTNGAPEPDSR
jgi:hypothetical protein